MQLTITSLCTTCALISALVVLLCILFRKTGVWERISPKCMVIILIMVIIRMLVPFEFSFTKTIEIMDVLTPLYDVLVYVLISEPFEIMVWHMLVAVWVVGAVCSLICKLRTYFGIIRYASLLPEESWDEIFERCRWEREEFRDMEKVRLVCCRWFGSPCLIGIRRPYLVLPELISDAERQRYTILHEVMHVRNRDIIWKVLIDLLCTVFWWNPVFRYLKKELFQLIEMRNDMQIVSELSENEQICYMECLKDSAVKMSNKDIAFSVAFNRGDFRGLKRRLELIAGRQRFSRWLQVGLGLLVCALLIGSSMIIVEPSSLKEIEDKYTILTEENTYLVVNGDEYDVYVEGEYLFTTDDLYPFRNNVKIYDSIEEVRE